MTRIPITVPDLDLANQEVTVSCWLVAQGRVVVEGDRVIEVAAGEVIVDLPAPASGRLFQRDTAEGEAVETGQVLGQIETETPDV